MSLQTTMGIPASGAASNGTFSLIGGIVRFQTGSAALPTLTITLSGNVDDPAAVILVNDILAVVSGGTFSADVLLLLGPNTITVEASDPLGNGTSVSITVYLDLPPEEKAKVPQVPGSLGEALDALEADHEFMLKGDVFTDDVISTWLEYKRENEVLALSLRPHPYEFYMYYDI